MAKRKRTTRPANPPRVLRAPVAAPRAQAFTISPFVSREVHASPYDRKPHDPISRRLRIYTQDPAASRFDAAVAEVSVPFEPLQPGPMGRIVEVVDLNESRQETYAPVDLDDVYLAIAGGLQPSTTDPRFAQQMAYAVTTLTYERFRQALGRIPDFSFEAPPGENDRPVEERCLRLTIRPHAREEANAWYDPETRELAFGYTFANPAAIGPIQPGAIVFTALSHDVVVHEMTHALLDGMRAHFLLPSNPDVAALHEAFADLVALFQRFRFRDLVTKAISHADGRLDSRLLTDIARQFGQATGDGRSALRTALLDRGDADDPVPEKHAYDPAKEEHELGGVLVAAVFEAFRRVFARKTEPLARIARHQGGPLSAEVIDLIARKAEDLAGQFLNIVIRAIDYCPPVDVTFGEYLRAIVTADFEVVPDDPWGYREAFVQAFRRYRIEVPDVPDLSEEALLWSPPEREFPPVPGLAFPELRHGLEPGRHAPAGEQVRRATALGEYVTADDRHYYFGLEPPRRSRTQPIDPPVVESVRTLRRTGPDGAVLFELVAEITQRRKARGGYWMYGGSTVIIGSDGVVRYAVNKFVGSTRRERRLGDFLPRAPAAYRDQFTSPEPRPTKVLRHLHRRR
jgi:hypothetical protein